MVKTTGIINFGSKVEDLKGLDQKILTIKQQFFDNALAYETLVLQGKGTKR